MCPRTTLALALAVPLTMIFLIVAVWVTCRFRKNQSVAPVLVAPIFGAGEAYAQGDRLDCQSPLHFTTSEIRRRDDRHTSEYSPMAVRRNAIEGRVYYTPADASIDTGNSASDSSSENDE